MPYLVAGRKPPSQPFFTPQPSTRLVSNEKTLQSEVPENALRFYMPAHYTAETELHEMFSKKRVRGEWFELTPQDIISVIGFLKQKGDLNRASADNEWLGKITLGHGNNQPATLDSK